MRTATDAVQRNLPPPKTLLLIVAFGFFIAPDELSAAYTFTDGLDPAKLKKDKVKIAVVKVKATRVVRPETRRRLPDGSSTYTFASYSIDLHLIGQFYGEELTDADLSDIRYSNVPMDNAWALGPSDPMGCYYIMAWRQGHPCGLSSGVQFPTCPSLPFLIEKPDDPSVKLLKELLAIVNATGDGNRKNNLDAKLKQLREAMALQETELDLAEPIALNLKPMPEGQTNAPAKVREDSIKDLFPIDRDGKWGFIDVTGQIAIEPVFEEVAYFSEGLAAVKLNGKYGYIDKKGKTVIEPQFGYAFAFREGLAWVDGEREGFIDKKGKIVLTPPADTYCRSFREGFAQAIPRRPRFPSLEPEWSNKIGFIDKTGQYVIPAKYDSARDFREGRAAVNVDGKWGFINKRGRFAIRPRFDQASDFSDGLASVEQDGVVIFVNRDGRKAIDSEYEDGHGFREGFAGVKIDGKWGFIDKDGKVRIEPRFEEVSSFFSGMAGIVMNRKYGYINKRGEIVVEPVYGYGHFFLGELAGVTFHPRRGDGSGTGYIDRKGRVIWTPEPGSGD